MRVQKAIMEVIIVLSDRKESPIIGEKDGTNDNMYETAGFSIYDIYTYI